MRHRRTAGRRPFGASDLRGLCGRGRLQKVAHSLDVLAGFWPLISMGATLAGTIGAPFTAVMFALELTHDINVLVAAMLAYATSGLG